MRQRARGLAALLVVLAVGVLGGSAISQWRARGTRVGVPDTVRHGDASARVRVEVLNGGGRSGAAREATELLRDVGFDVVFFGNASTFDRDSSIVLDRAGAPAAARDVADALGIRNVRSEPDPNLYLDVSVVLGTDWSPATTATVPEEAAPRRAWWDPRGWFHR